MSVHSTTDAMFSSPDAYDAFMGRYSKQLAQDFVKTVPLDQGDAVLDLGCGPGALTTELVHAVGASNVSAIDPSPPFLEACVARNPGVTGKVGVAENLPFDKGAFDAVLSLLVIHFIGDPQKAGEEVVRVTKPGGHFAASTWITGRMELIKNFVQAVKSVTGITEPPVRLNLFEEDGSLAAYMESIGLTDVDESTMAVDSTYSDFDEVWGAYLLGIGPMGPWTLQQTDETKSAIRSELFNLMGQPTGEVTLHGVAREAHGTIPA